MIYVTLSESKVSNPPPRRVHMRRLLRFSSATINAALLVAV